jgi:hypothetical protein
MPVSWARGCGSDRVRGHGHRDESGHERGRVCGRGRGHGHGHGHSHVRDHVRGHGRDRDESGHEHGRASGHARDHGVVVARKKRRKTHRRQLQRDQTRLLTPCRPLRPLRALRAPRVPLQALQEEEMGSSLLGVEWESLAPPPLHLWRLRVVFQQVMMQ